jgi:tetratricopeptide (TPR) repeat protein
LARAREAGEHVAQSIALTGLGVAQRILGENEASRTSLTEAYTICEALGDGEGMAHARMSLGNTLHNLGDYDGALGAYQRAEQLFRKSGRKGAVASALGNQSMVQAAIGHGDLAQALATESLAIGRAIGDLHVVISAQTKLASARLKQGDELGALALYEQVIPVARQRELWRALTSALSNMAHVLGKLDRHEETIPVLTESMAVAVRLGSPRSEALACGNLGLAYVELRNYDEASRHLDRAVRLAAGVDPRFEGGFRAGRAHLATLTRQDPRDDIHAAEALLLPVNDTEELHKLTCTKAVWAAQQGQLREAKALLSTVVAETPDVQRRVQQARRQIRGL